MSAALVPQVPLPMPSPPMPENIKSESERLAFVRIKGDGPISDEMQGEQQTTDEIVSEQPIHEEIKGRWSRAVAAISSALVPHVSLPTPSPLMPEQMRSESKRLVSAQMEGDGPSSDEMQGEQPTTDETVSEQPMPDEIKGKVRVWMLAILAEHKSMRAVGRCTRPCFGAPSNDYRVLNVRSPHSLY